MSDWSYSKNRLINQIVNKITDSFWEFLKQNILKPFVQISYRPPNSLGKFFQKKNKIDMRNEVEFINEGRIYRNFKTKLKEHLH